MYSCVIYPYNDQSVYNGFLSSSTGGASVSQIQILSHQAKIASKIEIFISNAIEYKDASAFTRLGYLSLDCNERSEYQARELKTVYIDQLGRYLKVLIHANHVNKLNLGNQVGIVAINVIGLEQSSVTNRAGLNRARRSDTDIPIAQMKSPSRKLSKDMASDMHLDSHTAAKLRALSEVKAQAVAEEDYATAKTIKTIEVIYHS